MPCVRHSSGSGTPASHSFRIWKIWLSVCRDFFIRRISCQWKILLLSPIFFRGDYIALDQGPLDSVEDVGRFILFDLFEASLDQKIARLGDESGTSKDWNADTARENGYKLVAYALPPSSALHKRLLTASDAKSQRLRDTLTQQLDKCIGLVSDDEVRSLCDRVATLTDAFTCGHSTAGATISALGDVLLGRDRLVRALAEDRQALIAAKTGRYGTLSRYVYGHTHAYEKKHPVWLPGKQRVDVWNTGAFQRLIDDTIFRIRLRTHYAGQSAAYGIRHMTLENDFKPCYTAVIGKSEADGSVSDLTVQFWVMREDETEGTLTPERYLGCIW